MYLELLRQIPNCLFQAKCTLVVIKSIIILCQVPDTATLLAVLQDPLEDFSPTSKAGLSRVLADPDPVMMRYISCKPTTIVSL